MHGETTVIRRLQKRSSSLKLKQNNLKKIDGAVETHRGWTSAARAVFHTLWNSSSLGEREPELPHGLVSRVLVRVHAGDRAGPGRARPRAAHAATVPGPKAVLQCFV